MHESVERLYEAARESKGLKRPVDVARVLGVSPQVLSNWELRGMSAEGAVEAEVAFGCRAAWLLRGNLPSGVTGENTQDRAPEVASSREVLARNLQRLVARHASRAALASHLNFPLKTLERAEKGDNAVSLDTLDELASGLGVAPWQLLQAGAELKAPAEGVTRPVEDGLAMQAGRLMEDFLACDVQTRRAVSRLVNVARSACGDVSRQRRRQALLAAGAVFAAQFGED